MSEWEYLRLLPLIAEDAEHRGVPVDTRFAVRYAKDSRGFKFLSALTPADYTVIARLASW